jgi:hypothetical protein
MYHEPTGADTPRDRLSSFGLAGSPRRNFVRAMAEKACMRALLRARDTESDDGDQPDDDSGSDDKYQRTPKPLLRMRCFACAGTGKLWVTDANAPDGRLAQCIACHGAGRVKVK